MVNTDNQQQLRAWLERLDWSQRYCAEWLTERGNPVTLRTVQRWLASDTDQSTPCPGWPAELIAHAHQRRQLMRTVTFGNQKGGVGKSSLACHLAFDLYERGYSVLFIDLDTQGNSSKTLAAYDTGTQASSLFESGGTVPTGYDFGLIASDQGLVKLDRADYNVIGHLRDALDARRGDYDWCVIDTPPTVGLRLSAALIVSNDVIAPVELEQYSIDGIERLLKTVYGIQQRANNGLRFAGMVPNRFDPRSQRQKDALAEMVEAYSQHIIQQPIGIRTAIPEALANGQPVWQVGKTSARDAGKQIRATFNEIYERMGVTHG